MIVDGWPDVIKCDDTGNEYYLYLSYEDSDEYMYGTVPSYGDGNVREWFDKSSRESNGGTNCDYTGESIDNAAYFTQYEFADGAATTTATSAMYVYNEAGTLFNGVLLFFIAFALMMFYFRKS